MKVRKCIPYESYYHSPKGEMLALVYGLAKFNHILRMGEFIVITDSNTVLHWSTMKDSGGTVLCWLDYIQQFNFMVTHYAGKYNINADLISRATHMKLHPWAQSPLLKVKKKCIPYPGLWQITTQNIYPPHAKVRLAQGRLLKSIIFNMFSL